MSVSDPSESKSTSDNTQSQPTELKPKLNLWEFSRMYQVYNIPITDFIIVYLILYCFSHIYSYNDYEMILIMTVAITLVFNMMTNPKLTVGTYNIIFIIVIVFLVYISYTKKKIE